MGSEVGGLGFILTGNEYLAQLTRHFLKLLILPLTLLPDHGRMCSLVRGAVSLTSNLSTVIGRSRILLPVAW